MTARITIDKGVETPLPDGAVLRSDVYRPDGPGPWPVLLTRTPYNKDFPPVVILAADPVRLAQLGFVVVVQDVRGRWSSDGGPFRFYRDEGADGAATITWIRQQDWCDGNVGVFGVSYLGGSAWAAAAHAGKDVGAIAAMTAPGDLHADHLWVGGALRWGLWLRWSVATIGPDALARAAGGDDDFPSRFAELVDGIDRLDRWAWHLPLGQVPIARPDDPSFLGFFHEYLEHPAPDDWSAGVLVRGRHDEVTAPALIIAGWYDVFLSSDLEHFAAMQSGAGSPEARRHTRLVVGPWAHGSFLPAVGDLDFGMRASGHLVDLVGDLTAMQGRWFDRRLRGADNGIDDEPRVALFVMGRNRWRYLDQWPPAATATPLYLRTGDALSLDPPNDGEGAATYTYDPADPCPTLGGSLLIGAPHRAGPTDQRPLLGRGDVVSFVSEPLDENLEVIGPVTAVLHAETSAVDTDWVVKLCDIHPDGRMMNVTDGILRARYREGHVGDGQLVTPGEVVEYRVELGPTAMVFLAGHRIGVLVTSSDFPRYDRNLNTGVSGIASDRMQVARQVVHHDASAASHVVLPVAT